MEPDNSNPTAPGGDPPRPLLLAFGELASIQVELLRIIERQAQPPQPPPVSRNALLQYWVPPVSQPSPWEEIRTLRRRAQEVLKWIAEQPGL